MVRQSLQELRMKLEQMRREKEAVETSLSAYEERRAFVGGAGTHQYTR